jgi:hypothetical protein
MFLDVALHATAAATRPISSTDDGAVRLYAPSTLGVFLYFPDWQVLPKPRAFIEHARAMPRMTAQSIESSKGVMFRHCTRSVNCFGSVSYLTASSSRET